MVIQNCIGKIVLAYLEVLVIAHLPSKLHFRDVTTPFQTRKDVSVIIENLNRGECNFFKFYSIV